MVNAQEAAYSDKFSRSVMVLTRPKAQNHRFAKELQAVLRAENYQIPLIEAPVRAIRFHEKFELHSQHFDARIITSSTLIEHYQSQLTDVPLFVVGRGTKSRALDYGARVWAYADRAEELSNVINMINKPLNIQWLTGDPYRWDFVQSVKFGKVQKQVMYQVEACQWTDSQIAEISHYDRAIFPVFSQASFESLQKMLRYLPNTLEKFFQPLSVALENELLETQKNAEFPRSWQVYPAPERPNAKEICVSLKKLLRNL